MWPQVDCCSCAWQSKVKYTRKWKTWVTPFFLKFLFWTFKKKFLMLIYFWERERDRERVGEGQRERERDRIRSRLQAPSCQHRAPWRAQTHESVRSWPEPKWDAQLTEPPRQLWVTPFLRKMQLIHSRMHKTTFEIIWGLNIKQQSLSNFILIS